MRTCYFYCLIGLLVLSISINVCFYYLKRDYDLSQEGVPQEFVNFTIDIAQKYLVSTPFEGKLVLNKPPTNSTFTIILFNSQFTTPSSVEFKNNCLSRCDPPLIVCDISFVDLFLKELYLDVEEFYDHDEDHAVDEPINLRPISTEKISTLRKFLFTWVIGHEIGHIINGHRKAFFEGTSLIEKADLRAISQQQEIEADAFVLKKIDPCSDANRSFYQFLIFDIMNNVLKMKACPKLTPLEYCNKIPYGVGLLQPNIPLLYSVESSHPEYVIRLHRIIKLIHEKCDLGGIGYINNKIIEALVAK